MKLLYACICFALISCSDHGSNVANVAETSPAGGISLSMAKTYIPQSIASLTFTLVNLSTSETVSRVVVVTSDSVMLVSFTDLAAGSWHVKVVAKDSSSISRFSGEADAVVTQGQVTQLNLSLNLTTTGVGTLNITVNWIGTAPFYDYPANPVLVKRGAWYDSRGNACPLVFADNGKYKMLFMNYGLLNGIAYTTVGLAESVDGTSWTRVADTVLLPTPNAWDAGTVLPSTVLKENGIYTMYYTGTKSSGVGYNIGTATSQDGQNWQKRPTTIMPGVLNISGGYVVKVGSKYYLYYHTAPTTSIYCATSTDGLTWVPYEGNPVLTVTKSWELTSIYYGSVMYENNLFTMVYSNDGYSTSFGLATSTDGLHWTKDARNPVFTKANTVNGWAPGGIAYPSLVRVGAEVRLYYTGYASDGTDRVGYAVKR